MWKRRALAMLVCWFVLVAAQIAVAADGATFAVYRLGDLDVPAADVIAGRHDAGAMVVPGPIIYPTRRVGGWWRVDALRDIPAEPVQALVVDAPNNTATSAWLPGQGSPLIRATVGPHEDPTFSPRLAVFPLTGGLRKGQHVYLYVKSSMGYSDTLQIIGVQALRSKDRQHLAVHSLIDGTLLALVLIGIGLGWILRESEFLVLGLGLGFALLYLLDGTAELYRLPGMAALANVRVAQSFFGTGAAICTAMFLVRYLQMATRTPRLAQIQRVVIAIYVMVLIGRLLPGIGLSPLWSTTGNLAMLVSTIIGFVAGVRGAMARHHPSRVFLWSWLPLLCFVTWRIFEITFGWPPSEALQYALPASFVLAGVLLMIGMADRILQYKSERDASDVLAHRDPLTGVYNRRALDERLLAAALDTGQRSESLALLFIDLDLFKNVNDQHGHSVGDECLREVARRIRTSLRFGDILGRYGGEEFVIGLPRLNLEDARAMGERIRHAVASRSIACNAIEVHITISVGAAVLHDGLAGFEAAILRADRALYASKRDGRNKVSILAA